MPKTKLSIEDVRVFDTKGVTPKYVNNSNTIVLNQKCVHDGTIDWSFAQYISDEQKIPSDKYIKTGDLLINSTGTGTAGRSAYVGTLPEHKKVVIDSHMLLVRFEDNALSQFFAYFLYSRESLIKTLLIGSSGQGELDKLSVFNIKFPYDKEMIDVFCELLNTINDKIELNNKINAELETVARNLYNYWFVQFEFLDASGRPYKTAGGVMVYNEELKREIPHKWAVGSISHIGKIVSGSTPSKKQDSYFNEHGMAWITPDDLSCNSNNKFITKGKVSLSVQGLNSASLKVMPKGTVLLTSRAPVGYMAIARSDVTTNQGFKSFVPDGGYTTPYVYYTLKTFMPTIINNSSGSTFKEISASALGTVKTWLPPIHLVESFTDQINPIFIQQDSLEQQNERLAKMRDFLLPLLMNGQVITTD